MADWGSPLPEGEGRGIAHHGELRVRSSPRWRTSPSPPRERCACEDVFAAVDCGDVVNTDSAKAQVEGGIIFGLSAALLGEITIAEGRVVEKQLPRLSR